MPILVNCVQCETGQLCSKYENCWLADTWIAAIADNEGFKVGIIPLIHDFSPADDDEFRHHPARHCKPGQMEGRKASRGDPDYVPKCKKPRRGERRVTRPESEPESMDEMDDYSYDNDTEPGNCLDTQYNVNGRSKKQCSICKCRGHNKRTCDAKKRRRGGKSETKTSHHQPTNIVQATQSSQFSREAQHWTLVVIDLPHRKMTMYDPMCMHEQDEEHWKRPLCAFLPMEWREKGYKETLTKLCNWSFEVATVDAFPQQQDSESCGMFVCCYADCIAQGIHLKSFSHRIIPAIRSQTAALLRTCCEGCDV
mmetsp:Transcript_9279/g.31001  ORF Transcript_9279/g.31001 Transcript_9279/m.31001 type:complete len:310 (+) Transcript_9279:1655-2584(+)